MAMPLSTAIQTSLRKYRRKKFRTFFGIAPTVLLFVFIVLLSGLALSIDSFIHKRIITKLEQREEVFELSKAGGSFMGPRPQSDSGSDSDDPASYSNEDLAKVKAVKNVADVQPERPLPDMLAVTTDLVTGKELQLSSFVGAPTDLSRIYNAEGFIYKSSEPIPIIISRSVFNYSSLDFGGKKEVTLTEKDFMDATRQRDLNPHKTTFLSTEYQKNTLVNKTLTVKFGGLPRLPAYIEKNSSNQSSFSTTFRPLSVSEQQAEIKKQRDLVSPYWNYEALQQGVSRQFKIVGFNDSLDNGYQFIPLAASGEILQQLYDLQRSARTKTVLPEDVYAKFNGLRLSKNGQISSAGNLFMEPINLIPAKREFAGRPPEPNSETIIIPGWLTQTIIKDGSGVSTEVANFVFKPEALAIKALAVRLDDAANRQKVQKALSSSGFPEAGESASFTGMLRGIRTGLSSALFWIVVVLTVINSIILISTVSRTVADAQREIGVYRALGARKRDIRKLYVVYSALQTAIGIGSGLLIGLILVGPTSSFLAGKVKNFLPFGPGADAGFLGLDLNVTPADLQGIDWQRILLYSPALLIVTIAVSLLPAARAARISPVEAIRRAD